MRLSSLCIHATVVLAMTQVSYADGGANHQVTQAPPVKMGTSGGSVADHSNLFCCSGTLGALVLRDGVLCILSNNHILARSGVAAAGEDTLQPGLVDTNCSGAGSNIVGDFIGNLVPLGNNVDAALSIARSNVDASGAIIDIGVPCSNPQTATVGMPVRKSGRTTGFTTGTVTSVNTSVQIQYQKGCGKGKKFVVTYTNQIVTGAMSAGGDSGSVLYSNNDSTPNPVGLLYAGSSSTTIYNPIQHVINAFTAGGHTFTFVGSSCSSLVPEGPAGLAPTPEEMADALQVKVENETELFQHAGVVGVGVGPAEDNPLQAVIVVYVESPNGNVPPNAHIPDSIGNLPVRTIVTDKIVAQ